MTDFQSLVRRMRAAQRLFFDTRDPEVLRSAESLERQVDAELHGDPKQGSLGIDLRRPEGYGTD